MIRAIDPTMLQQGPDGFSVDFSTLDGKAQCTADEELLQKIRVALETVGDATIGVLDLIPGESRRLAETLGQLEKLQDWAPDVLVMTRKLRARLLTAE